MGQQNRQAATFKGAFRRLADAELHRLTDRRDRRGRRYSHRSLVSALMLGMLLGLRSLRAVESMTAGLRRQVRSATGIGCRLSDTKLRDELMSLDPAELRPALHRQVKAEHRRGNLAAKRLPFGLVAIDGKGIGKLDSWAHPDVQRVRPSEAEPYGLARVHRAHLVSSEAIVCVDQRPIPGATNELGTVCDFTRELLATYGRTDLFEAIIADAGGCSLEHATALHEAGCGYILALKEPAGELHRETLRLLEHRPAESEDHCYTRRERGCAITHRVWTHRLDGYLDWSHARQVARIQRVVERDGQVISVGNRYFATNMPLRQLDPRRWLTAVQLYWRCENNGHWTTDVVWSEDARRTPWTTAPAAVYALSLLRMLALNIVSILRTMSRREHTSQAVPWKEVIQLLRWAFAAPALSIAEPRLCI